MTDRKANLLIALVFDENADVRKQIDTELSFKEEVIKDLQHLIHCKEIKHYLVAEDDLINQKLTADVIEREKINKAIKEIEDYNIKTNFASCSETFQLGVTRGLDLASEILKRNIGE